MFGAKIENRKCKNSYFFGNFQVSKVQYVLLFKFCKSGEFLQVEYYYASRHPVHINLSQLPMKVFIE